MEMNDIYYGLVIVASVVVLAWLLNWFMDSIWENDNE